MTRIEEIIQELRSLQFSEKDKIYSLTNELLQVALEAEDYDTVCSAYNKLSKCAFMNSEFDSAITYAFSAIDVAQRHDFPKPLAEAHCVLGILYTKQNNEPQAIKHFHKAIKINKRIDNYSELSSVYTNIGAMYSNLEDYDRELMCYETGEYYIEKMHEENPDYPMYEYHRLIQNLNKAMIYAKLGNNEKLNETLKLIEAHRGEPIFNSIIQFINLLYTKSAYFSGDYSGFFENAEIVLRTAPIISYGIDILKDYFDIFDYLVKLEAYDQAKDFLQIIDPVAIETKSNSILVANYRRQLFLNRKLNYLDRFTDLLPRYVTALHMMNEEMDSLQRISLNSYIHLEQEIHSREQYQEELVTLQHQSSYDALTGLANRSFLDLYCESTFASCINKHVGFGVIVIDIDDFKNYNDSYGHLAGDYCIMQAAKVIHDKATNHFCARFGGDEFFIITTNISEDEINTLCMTIQGSLNEIMENDKGHSLYTNVTLSFGYFADIPEKGHLLTDYISNADNALYQAKSQGKNRIARYEAT